MDFDKFGGGARANSCCVERFWIQSCLTVVQHQPHSQALSSPGRKKAGNEVDAAHVEEAVLIQTGTVSRSIICRDLFMIHSSLL